MTACLQVFWCDGLGSDAAALAGFADAGLPIRALLHVHEDGAEAAALLTGVLQICTSLWSRILPTQCMPGLKRALCTL